MKKSSFRRSGFTIIELLVVIVIIGILASLSFVAYGSVRAKVIDESVTADVLRMKSAELKYKTDTGKSGEAYYNNNGTGSDLNFTPSSGNFIDVAVYPKINPTSYCIRGYNTGGTKNTIWNSSTLESSSGTCDSTDLAHYLPPSDPASTESPLDSRAITCPTGFIVVPGSPTYGTGNFCVMKYEAKQVGSTNVPISQASGLPWISISQTDAIANSPNVVGCTGCHLITEAQYLTIIQNVLKVASNWSTGIVGSGYIYSGYGDSTTTHSLAASSNDSLGYSGESVSSGPQRRTLTLSNGAVIWDLAGNVWEWTSGTFTTGQPGVTGGGIDWREWTAVTNLGTLLPNIFPSGTGISGANTWNNSKGIGEIYSTADETGTQRSFMRGGSWWGNYPGVLSVALNFMPDWSDLDVGFRVAQ